MSPSTDAARRAAFEDECLDAVRRYLADGRPMRDNMESHGGRQLRSLSLERTADDALIVAEMTLTDGTPLVERYSVWTYDKPSPSLSSEEATQVGFMIAVGLTTL